MLRSDFKYNGKSLSDFQMKMYDPDEDPHGVARTIEKSQPNAAREIPNHYTTFRSDVLVHHFLIIKDPEFYGDSNNLRLTDKEIHRLKSWLFSTKVPTELILPMDDEEINVSYFGVFTDVQYFVPVQKSCYGLKLTFTCNAPYGFSPVTSKRFWINSASVTGDFVNNVVEFADMLPPTIVIRATDSEAFDGEQLVLQNKNDGDKEMRITLTSGLHRIDIDCSTKIITGYYMENDVEKTRALTLADIGLELYEAQQDNTRSFQLINTYGMYWLKLVPGSNVLQFTTDGFAARYSVEVRTRYIIEAGGF